VSKSRTVSGERCLTWLKKAAPSISGMRMSETTTPGGSSPSMIANPF